MTINSDKSIEYIKIMFDFVSTIYMLASYLLKHENDKMSLKQTMHSFMLVDNRAIRQTLKLNNIVLVHIYVTLNLA